MATAFQATAFQNNAFQITVIPGATPPGETILQRHKVDRLWTGYGVSRKRYQDYQKQWQIDAINAKAAAREKKRKEVDAPLGYAKIEYDKYGHQVAAGEAAFHELMRGLEMAQTQRAFQQAQLFARDMSARQDAIAQFNRETALAAHGAEMRQFAKDTAEEEEALELLMMDD